MQAPKKLVSLPDEASAELPVRDWWKRPFDIAILCIVHILLAPIWLVLWIAIPLAIRLYDGGPVFYTQQRLGKNGRVFKIYKFRSMVQDAERSTGMVWADKDDPRITPIGRFLRKRAMDELPQVINLWKGDISLVGPRPERPALSFKFAERNPDFHRRLLVRPGMTGLAQVRGYYATHPKHKLYYDLLYIKRMSPLLDIKLLFMSVWLTFRAKWQEKNR